MTFINPEQHNINLSDFHPEDILCGPLASEDIPGKTTSTESGLRIELEPSCDPTFDFDCRKICRDNHVASGSFTISNSCTMPITITGFKMTDPDRFSLFKFPDYTGVKVYHSGIVEALPFTLKPEQKKQIHTFFHPLYDESMTGNEGTMLNRTGDQFGSYVKIKPGFPILNCDDNNCQPVITLTGEFLQKNEIEVQWGSNKENFDQDFNKESLGGLIIKEINNEYFLKKKLSKIFTIDSDKKIREQYLDLFQVTIDYARDLEDNSWYENYGDYGVTGSIGLFSDIIKSVIDTTSSAAASASNEEGGSMIVRANQYLGSDGNFIRVKLQYDQAENDISISDFNLVTISRSEATGEEVNSSVIVEQINTYIEENNSDIISSSEYFEPDGKILAFDKRMSGGSNGRTTSLNNIHNRNFENEYEQLDAFYNETIKFKSHYNTPKTTITYNENYYIGLVIYNNPIENIPLMSNQAVFYKIDGESSEIFICDVGDFENDTILE